MTRPSPIVGRPHSQRHTAQRTQWLWQETGKRVSTEPDPSRSDAPSDPSWRFWKPYDYAYGQSNPALRPVMPVEDTPVSDYVQRKRRKRKAAARPPVKPTPVPDDVPQYRRRQLAIAPPPPPEPWWLDPDELVSRNTAMIDDLLGDEVSDNRISVFSWPKS